MGKKNKVDDIFKALNKFGLENYILECHETFLDNVDAKKRFSELQQ